MLGRVSDEGRVVGGRYRLLSPLGSGGTGTVWRAVDQLLGREVAVKEVLLPHGLSEGAREDLRERTRREARAAARLDHPSVVTVYDVIEEEGSPFLVMELVEARTLAEQVRTDGPLTPEQAARVGLAVLGALEQAHAHGIVHRDVKPGNVLLRRDGRVILTDFGIATRAGDSSLTGTGLLLGSPSYIAPERAKGEDPGPASDLWSLGATLFTAVEGRPPYDAGDPIVTMTSVVLGQHAPFVAAGPLAPVIEALLTKDPTARLDAAGARRALQSVAERRGNDAPPAAAPRPEPAAGERAEHTSALPVPALPLRRPTQPARLPAQQPTSGRRAPAVGRGRGPVLVGLALLAAVLAAGLTLSGVLSGSSQRGAGQGAAAAPTPGRASTAATGSPAASPGSVPVTAGPGGGGSEPVSGAPALYRDGDGWSVARPAGWQTGTFRGQLQLREPTSGRVLRVDTSPLGDDVPAAVRDTANGFRSRYPSYRELRLAPEGGGGVVWEFTYTDGGTPLHAVVHSRVTGGHSYALLFQTRAADWSASAGTREALLSSFTPAG